MVRVFSDREPARRPQRAWRHTRGLCRVTEPGERAHRRWRRALNGHVEQTRVDLVVPGELRVLFDATRARDVPFHPPVALIRAVDVRVQLFARDSELPHHARGFQRAPLLVRGHSQPARSTFERVLLRLVAHLTHVVSPLSSSPNDDGARDRRASRRATHHLGHHGAVATPLESLERATHRRVGRREDAIPGRHSRDGSAARARFAPLAHKPVAAAAHPAGTAASRSIASKASAAAR